MTETTTINHATKSNNWNLTINNSLIKLTVTSRPGTCSECQKNKTIRLISQKEETNKNFCWSCALDRIYLLEKSNCEIVNKTQLIKELRAELNNPDYQDIKEKKLWSDYYKGKKPHCWSCWEKKMPADTYEFCGDNCSLHNWIKYYGSANLIR